MLKVTMYLPIYDDNGEYTSGRLVLTAIESVLKLGTMVCPHPVSIVENGDLSNPKDTHIAMTVYVQDRNDYHAVLSDARRSLAVVEVRYNVPCYLESSIIESFDKIG